MAEFLRKCQVIKDYQASNTDPFSVQPDESFYVSEKIDFWSGNPSWIWVWCTDQRGKSGWVPKNIIRMHNDESTANTCSAYSALELTIVTGNELQMIREESGWLWCIDQQEKQGWVPLEHVLFL